MIKFQNFAANVQPVTFSVGRPLCWTCGRPMSRQTGLHGHGGGGGMAALGVVTNVSYGLSYNEVSGH